MKRNIIILAIIVLVIILFYIIIWPKGETYYPPGPVAAEGVGYCVITSNLPQSSNPDSEFSLSHGDCVGIDNDNSLNAMNADSRCSASKISSSVWNFICIRNRINTIKEFFYYLAIICFILSSASFILWKIFRNKLKDETIIIIAKILLFLSIIALILSAILGIKFYF